MCIVNVSTVFRLFPQSREHSSLLPPIDEKTKQEEEQERTRLVQQAIGQNMASFLKKALLLYNFNQDDICI